MPEYVITGMQAKTARSYLTGKREGIYARVEFPSGASYEVSQLAGETAWTVDASWGKGSFPHWANGYGARYLMTKVIADAGLVSALDTARDALHAPAREVDAEVARWNAAVGTPEQERVKQETLSAIHARIMRDDRYQARTH